MWILVKSDILGNPKSCAARGSVGRLNITRTRDIVLFINIAATAASSFIASVARIPNKGQTSLSGKGTGDITNGAAAPAGNGGAAAPADNG